MISDAVVTGTF